jgi:dGTPase
MLANYACNYKNSKGRLYSESNSLSPFVIDRMRIIESTAFRRLEHKTQVFISSSGDHYRNRLTHSLEVAQIARIISHSLNISADLAENIALAHDMGHAPFGHAGEDALNESCQEYDLVFDHNAHTIKLLTSLEKRYPQFDGLNLSWETLEGIAKHNGLLLKLHPTNAILIYNQKHDLDLNRYPYLEAQVASLSDDIAYNNHDIDDGFRAGLINLEDLSEVQTLGSFITQVKNEYPKAEDYRLAHEAVQRMRNAMIYDVIENTKNNIRNFSIRTNEDVRNLKIPLVTFSNDMETYHKKIKQFLMNKVYTSSKLNLIREEGKKTIQKLFYIYMNDPKLLPKQWQTSIFSQDKKEIAKIVSDFIACMSDRYAIEVCHQLSLSMI